MFAAASAYKQPYHKPVPYPLRTSQHAYSVLHMWYSSCLNGDVVPTSPAEHLNVKFNVHIQWSFAVGICWVKEQWKMSCTTEANNITRWIPWGRNSNPMNHSHMCNVALHRGRWREVEGGGGKWREVRNQKYTPACTYLYAGHSSKCAEKQCNGTSDPNWKQLQETFPVVQ